MNGILLLALGAASNEVRLPHPVKVMAYCTALYGTYVNWLVSVVEMGFLSVTIAIVGTSIFVLWGLRGRAAEFNDGWTYSEFNIPRGAEGRRL